MDTEPAAPDAKCSSSKAVLSMGLDSSKVEPDRLVGWFVRKADVLLIPAVGYVLAFYYSRAYCASFGIPVEFVRVDLSELLIFSSSVFVFGLPLYLIFVSFLELGDPQPSIRVPRKISFYIVLAVSAIVLRVGLDLKWTSGYVELIGVVFTVALLSDLLAMSMLVRFLGRRDAISEGAGLYFRRGKEKFGENFILIILLFVGSFFSSALGASNASRRSEVSVLVGNPNAYLVTIADGKAVCAIYDQTTKRYSGRFIVVDLSEKGGVSFERKAVDPVTP